MTKVISYDHKHQQYKTWNSEIIVENNEYIITKNAVPFKISYSTGKEKKFQIQTFITYFFHEWFNIITVYNMQ